ncbi:unnamed protein product [Mytilus coruscus]|uniref:Uncharacterized protein n=1 Tax=Mytilus coruscus TaxID=42192 RepID=A0A6J8CZ05_MYTCO|nr:unnamed protein product [Mytilus coruscus]
MQQYYSDAQISPIHFEHTALETGSDEYTLRLLIDGKAECQKLVKKYPESCSSPAIQIKDAEQGSVILHISIHRKTFTCCESLHNEIQLFINTILCHKEIQWTDMPDFNMVLAIADYTEQDTDIRKTNTKDISLHSEQDADQEDKWEPYNIDIEIAEDSTNKSDISSNSTLHWEGDVNQEDRWEPHNIANGKNIIVKFTPIMSFNNTKRFPDSTNKSDIASNSTLHWEGGVNQEDRWEPQNTANGKNIIVVRDYFDCKILSRSECNCFH